MSKSQIKNPPKSEKKSEVIKSKPEIPSPFSFIDAIIKKATVPEKLKNSLSKVLDNQTLAISAAVESQKTESEYFLDLLKKPWNASGNLLDTNKALIQKVNMKVKNNILKKVIDLKPDSEEVENDRAEKERVEAKKYKLFCEMDSMKLGYKQLQIWKKEIMDWVNKKGLQKSIPSENDIVNTIIGLKVLKKYLQNAKNQLENTEMHKLMKTKVQPADVEKQKIKDKRRKIIIDKFNKSNEEDKKNQQAQKILNEKKKKDLEFLFNIKNQWKEEFKEEKRRLNREYKDLLKKQNEDVVSKIMKTDPSFDIQTLPKKASAHQMYQHYLECRAKAEFESEVEEKVRQRLCGDKELIKKAFNDDEYIKKILVRKQKEDQAYEMQKHKSELLEKSILQSKIQSWDLTKPFYELPKEAVKAREDEKKKKIKELVKKWKDERPFVPDEKKKEEREKLIERIHEKEHIHDKIEELKKEAKEKLPDYLEEVKKINATKPPKKKSSPKDQSPQPVLKKKDKNSFSLPQIPHIQRKSADNWELALKNKKLSRLGKYEQLLFETEKLDEIGKRKEMLAKFGHKGQSNSTAKVQSSQKDDSDLYYMSSIKAKLALLNEL